jgi:hypothetical protein
MRAVVMDCIDVASRSFLPSFARGYMIVLPYFPCVHHRLEQMYTCLTTAQTVPSKTDVHRVQNHCQCHIHLVFRIVTCGHLFQQFKRDLPKTDRLCPIGFKIIPTILEHCATSVRCMLNPVQVLYWHKNESPIETYTTLARVRFHWPTVLL